MGRKSEHMAVAGLVQGGLQGWEGFWQAQPDHLRGGQAIHALEVFGGL